MDKKVLTELLRATFEGNAAQVDLAEKQLSQMHEMKGFMETILGILRQNALDKPTRQAAAVYLKNLVTTNWVDQFTRPGEPIIFKVNEQDRTMFRNVIINDIVLAPEYIRWQLLVCVKHIVNIDLPKRWPQCVTNIIMVLQNPNRGALEVGLVIMYEIVKTYKHKLSEQCIPMNEAMNILLPIMVNLSHNQSEQSVLFQKHILKIYYGLIRNNLPLDLINNGTFSQWIAVCLRIVVGEMPDCSDLTDNIKMEFPYWKLKKWAMHIILLMFERYGNPHKVVSKIYDNFAKWFMENLSESIMNVMMKILAKYGKGVYISSRVLSYVLIYLNTAIDHEYTFKLIKPHAIAIIKDVILPVMSFTDADQALWHANPNKYIRRKFELCTDHNSPVFAAKCLLYGFCEKHQSILLRVISVIMSTHADNKRMDGAFQMIGFLANILIKEEYQNELENILKIYVLPEFDNSAGHLRARAWWVFQHFHCVSIYNEEFLGHIMLQATDALLNDNELPVKVEAALCLQHFLATHDEAAKYVEYKVLDITKDLLIIMCDAENGDLTYVLQNIMKTFTDELLPITTEICQCLSAKFIQVFDFEHSSHAKAYFATLLLKTLVNIFIEMEDRRYDVRKIFPLVVKLIDHILQENNSDYYSLIFSLIRKMTSKTISPPKWQLLDRLYQVFKNDGIEYFNVFMPSLYNYVTVNTKEFLSDKNRLLVIFDICKTVLTGGNTNLYAECNAAKLLEVIILQCKGKGNIDCVLPDFVELAMARITPETPLELKTMCSMIPIASIYYNPHLLLSIWDNMSQPNKEPISTFFIKQWLDSIDRFYSTHDKRLCVLSLCKLISLGDAKPPVLIEIGNKILPAFIKLFEGLKRSNEPMDQLVAEDDNKEEMIIDSEEEEQLASVEEEEHFYETIYSNFSFNLDEFGKNTDSKVYIEDIKKEELTDKESSEEEEEFDSAYYTGLSLETYSTPIDKKNPVIRIDERLTFINVFTVNEPWLSNYFYDLTQEQSQSLSEIITGNPRKK